MQGYRSLSFPLAHLAAEMISAPLTCEVAFRQNIIRLDPKIKDKATQMLWRMTEQELARSFSNTSLDELINYRDLLWFGVLKERNLTDYDGEVGLLNLLLHLEKRLTEQEFERDPFGGFQNSYMLKLWLSFALPPDLLRYIKLPSLSNPLHPVLSRMLADRGYAETHIHVGASFDFTLLWSAVMRCVATIPNSEMKKAFQSPGACFNEGRELGNWLVLCGFGRVILAKYLTSRSRSFAEYAQNELMPYLNRLTYDYPLRDILHELFCSLETGTLPERLVMSDIKQIYGTIIANLAENSGEMYTPIGELIDCHVIDPIAQVHPTYEFEPEKIFLKKGFSYLRKNDGDTDFERLFWQTVRIRCMTYKYLIQRPMTPGLQWFIRHFGRISPFKKCISTSERIAQAIKNAKHQDGLKSLELRTLPDSQSEVKEIMKATWNQIKPKKEADDSNVSGQPQEDFELGWVFHFIRDRGGGFSQGTLSSFGIGQASDPTLDKNNGYRFGAYGRKTLRQASELSRFLITYPASLTLIRGIDVCNDELGIPNWVLVPAFKKVAKGVKYAREAYKRYYGCEAPQFHKTAHTGEDFVHLITGLRKIYESIWCFDLRQGDRLGHAIALGTNCDLWFDAIGIVPLTIENRLFDLCWEWSVTQSNASPISAARHPYLKHQIITLAQRLFQDEKLDHYYVIRWYEHLHDLDHLQWAGFPIPEDRFTGHPSGLPEEHRILHVKIQSLTDRYLRDEEIHRRGQEVIFINMQDAPMEREAIQFLQNYLHAKISRLGLTVEVNPTSNLLVANLSDLKRHPLWQFKSPDLASDGRSVPICIGSDDPTIFATSIALEYQTLYESLILSGITNDEAFDWIYKIRQTGLNARFTLPRTECKDPFEWENEQDYDILGQFN